MSTPPPSPIPVTLPGIPPQGIARARRATFFVLALLGTLLGAWLLSIYLSSGGGWRWAEVLLLLCFIPLYYQLNGGFWTALIGVWLQNRPEDDPLDLWKTIETDDSALTASTAIINVKLRIRRSGVARSLPHKNKPTCSSPSSSALFSTRTRGSAWARGLPKGRRASGSVIVQFPGP